MSITSSPLAALSGSAPLNSAADSLLREAAPAGAAGGKDQAKAEKAGKDFESLLLGQWLQGAEDSFGKLPGGDDDEDADAGTSSMQGIAMQSLGQAMTASGGIGIARMITAQLQRNREAETPAASVTPTHGYQGSRGETEKVS